MPQISLDLIARHSPAGGSVVDVGAGASLLVDHLLGTGRDDLTVLDVSSEGLDETKTRLGARADEVIFLVSDLLAWKPERRFEVWHDRAVFDFLTDAEDRDAYVEVASGAVDLGGVVMLGTFAKGRPRAVLWPPTASYDRPDLAAAFGEYFDLVEELTEVHRTPWGSDQLFTWVVLRRR